MVDGGGDPCEDLVGALKYARESKILSFNPKHSLCTILICDDPCHGKQYHNYKDETGDRFLDSVPKGTLENEIRNYSNICKRHSFTCL